jgi:hypothetical protein
MKGSKPGEPPGTGQLVGVHPAPERPGTSVNHNATPRTVATAGNPAQIVALRIRLASLRVRGRSFFHMGGVITSHANW